MRMSSRPVRSATMVESPSAERSISPSSGIGACNWNISVPASGHSDICRFIEPSFKRCHASREQNIGHDGTHAECLARKADGERVPHEAMAAVSADEIAHTNDLFATFACKPCRAKP
jgi:hypothetical protein